MGVVKRAWPLAIALAIVVPATAMAQTPDAVSSAGPVTALTPQQLLTVVSHMPPEQAALYAGEPFAQAVITPGTDENSPDSASASSAATHGCTGAETKWHLYSKIGHVDFAWIQNITTWCFRNGNIVHHSVRVEYNQYTQIGWHIDDRWWAVGWPVGMKATRRNTCTHGDAWFGPVKGLSRNWSIYARMQVRGGGSAFPAQLCRNTTIHRV